MMLVTRADVERLCLMSSVFNNCTVESRVSQAQCLHWCFAVHRPMLDASCLSSNPPVLCQRDSLALSPKIMASCAAKKCPQKSLNFGRSVNHSGLILSIFLGMFSY